MPSDVSPSQRAVSCSTPGAADGAGAVLAEGAGAVLAEGVGSALPLGDGLGPARAAAGKDATRSAADASTVTTPGSRGTLCTGDPREVRWARNRPFTAFFTRSAPEIYLPVKRI
jgi:hypothetical protein